MSFKRKIVEFSVNHYKLITVISILMALLGLSQFPFIKIDTDPENMLSEKEFVRKFDHQVKKEFGLYDIIVLGIVNEDNKNGVFNKNTLTKIYTLTKQIKKIEIIENNKKVKPIIDYDLISPSTVDDISQGNTEGSIKFEWLMAVPPETDAKANEIGVRAKNNPFLDGTMISESGKALCIYVPVLKKEYSHQVSVEIQKLIDKLEIGNEKYYITGLPVAEDTFGVEMFKQMATSAPIAGLIIFLLMWFFFKNVKLIISPMIVAIVSILFSMGIMIGLGYTVHIMSSMIAIFLMPIAVVDSVHIISDFFEKYQIYKDRKKTIIVVMEELFMPMLYTSLTSSVGFVSLATAPIPPVQIFGIFVGLGIMTAWILTMTFVPASIMFISDKTLENFGAKKNELTEKKHLLGKILGIAGNFIFNNAKLIIVLTVILTVISVMGIMKININDNPVKWFDKQHKIRIADKVLNKHFGGTYMAYLVFEDKKTKLSLEDFYKKFNDDLKQYILDFGITDELIISNIKKDFNDYYSEYITERKLSKVDKYDKNDLLIKFYKALKLFQTQKKYNSDLIEELIYFLDEQKIKTQLFKNPEMLRYIDKLQKYMNNIGVGKSNSISTIVKKVYKELRSGKQEFFRIPDSARAVGECLIQFQSSHRKDDLGHFVTPKFDKINIWVQLKSGDNQKMSAVEKKVNEFLYRNPAPKEVIHNWAGMTYINVVWQDKMVKGMLQNSLISSYIAVLIMMIFLFRSIWWGLLSMIPLTVTIMFIYGFIGFIGKDYDMPVAVLSSLTLGLAVDFAIHFLERFREMIKEESDIKKAVLRMFDEPAAAISRNIIVIALGFLPLLLSSLVPYQTVGFFLSAIMLVSGIGTLFILPAILKDIIGDFSLQDKK